MLIRSCIIRAHKERCSPYGRAFIERRSNDAGEEKETETLFFMISSQPNGSLKDTRPLRSISDELILCALCTFGNPHIMNFSSLYS